MLHDPRAALHLLLSDPKLDKLVEEARKHASAITPPTEVTDVVAADTYFAESISKVGANALDARRALANAASEKLAARAEKVAIARHIVKVAGRLLAPAA